MRTLSTAQTYLLGLSHRQHRIKVEIDQTGSGSWIDMSSLYGFDWVLGATWNESIDAPVANAVVTLRSKIHQLSLNPLATSSPPNVGGVLCRPYRRLRISTATVALGMTPASGDYQLVFRGRIWKVSHNEAEMQLECRDEGGDLQDIWITRSHLYGDDTGVAVEDICQAILDAGDAAGTTLWSENGTGGTPFAVADSPGWSITPQRRLTEMSTLDALNGFFRGQIGWDLRYRWHETAGDFKLVAYEPNRSAASQYTISSDLYTVTGFRMSNADVRNFIRIRYVDVRSGDWSNYDAEDATSQTTYGIKFMQLAEEATSQINDLAQATVMGDALLADLKDPVAYVDISMPYFWPVQLNDYYTLAANGVQIPSDQDLAVSAIGHSFDTKGGARTTLSLSGVPKAAARWFLKQGSPPAREVPTPFTNSAAASAVRNAILGVYTNG